MTRLFGSIASILLFAWPVPSLAKEVMSARHERLAAADDRVEILLRFPAPVLERRQGWVEARVAGAPAVERPGQPLLPEYRLLVAVPVGTVPELTLLEVEEVPIEEPSPPAMPRWDPEKRRLVMGPLGDGEEDLPAASVEVLGVARHVSLARVVARPARYEQASRRWIGSRRMHVAIAFRPAPTSATAADPDGVDLELASAVVNPSALPSAFAVSPSTPEAAETAIPTPEPSSMTPAKILVRSAGMYRVTRAELGAAGVSTTGIDPRTFVLTNRGSEVRIEVTGEADGVFDSGDVIRFYGEPIGGEETLDNVYRLTGGIRTGLRMSSRGAAPGSASVPSKFRNVSVSETNALYWGSLPADAPSPWFWDELAVATPGVPVFVDRTVQLANVSTASGTARLEVAVRSRRETPGASPNHHVRIYLNGNLVDDRTWTGLQGVTLADDVPQSWVREGTNTVRIENPSDLGLTAQSEYTDWIRLRYDDRYVAEADALEFGADTAGTWKFQVSGFTGSDGLVYDVADPKAPVRLTGATKTQSGSTWTVAFQSALSSPPGRFVALRPSAARSPHAIVVDTPSDLRARASSGADLLVIVHDAFHGAAQRLAELRRAEGLRVVTAKLTDVFDEFHGGIAETQGIRNFVEWAFFNYASPAPAAVLLVGDATYDPAGYRGEGDNYVSSRFFWVSGFGLAPDDNWFGSVNGADEVPDLAVGRINARSVADLDLYIDNLTDYENAPPAGPLNSGMLYVADDDDPGFEASLEGLIADFQPPAMLARRVYLNDYPQTTEGVSSARADIKVAVDAGSLITTYHGHGGRTLWASESLWDTGDVASLAATNRLTFAVALSCVNGYFVAGDAEPYSLNEQWNRVADRGAAAGWANSATGVRSSYETLVRELFRQIFELRRPRLGDASWRALLNAHLVSGIPISYVRQMIFFGDPLTRIPLDSDRDTRLDQEEIAAGTDPDDADSDDDGRLDEQEPAWNVDTDGDGLVNAADYDADDDALPDGLEVGITTPSSSTDTTRGHFIADANPATTTDPLDADTDGGGAPDGAEDRNTNGRLDTGEKNPLAATDDPACRAARPPEVSGLRVAKSGADASVSWNSQIGSDACVLYRVYAARSTHAEAPDAFSDFVYEGTVAQPTWKDRGAISNLLFSAYLATAVSPTHGEGPLGHYGR